MLRRHAMEMVFWIASGSKVVQFSSLLIGFGHRKHLVGCGGEIYMVDRYVDPLPRDKRLYMPCQGKEVEFKVHKLDEEWGGGLK